MTNDSIKPEQRLDGAVGMDALLHAAWVQQQMGIANVYRTPRQRKLDQARAIAAEVRKRHPEMQVKRIT